jgi:hypothetical protein
MGFTSQDLIRALAVSCGTEPDDLAEAVLLVRRFQPSFAATLYSAWKAEGLELNQGLAFDLESARARIDFYRSLAGQLSDAVPGLTPVKGLAVADLYPGGLVRAMNDLDYVVTDERDLWQAVSILVADGWDIDTATFTTISGSLHVMVSMRRPHPDPCLPQHGVEIMTYCSFGDLCGGPLLISLPAAWQPPAIKNTLMLLYERFEQPYRARDLIDASLLLASASGEQVAELMSAIGRLGLQPEYGELAERTGAAGLGPLPVPPQGWLAGPAARAGRAVRSASQFTRPLAGAARHLQRRRLTGRPLWPERKAWAAVSRLLPPGAAVTAGLLGFALPLDGPPPAVRTAVLRQEGKLAWVDTPVARFLLTVGDEVDQSAVDELATAEEGGVPVIADAAESTA